MERAIAVKKIAKLLGKSMGYRVDPTAPTHDERKQARESLIAASENFRKADKLCQQRINDILDADQTLKVLRAERDQWKQVRDKWARLADHYRFTVGISNSLFFHVKAQGDSWEEIISKLQQGAQK